MSAHPATASPLLHRYTLDEFFALDAPSGGGHYELIAGVLYMVPPPSGTHNIVASRLGIILATYAAAHPKRCTLFFPRAPISTARNTYLEPELFLVNSRRLRIMDPARLTTADLIVEVMSPSTAVYDRTAKADTYAALAVRELWLVDLEARTIEQRILRARAWRVVGVFGRTKSLRGHVFPDLVVGVGDVFG